jgi:hypothetical protein
MTCAKFAGLALIFACNPAKIGLAVRPPHVSRDLFLGGKECAVIPRCLSAIYQVSPRGHKDFLMMTRRFTGMLLITAICMTGCGKSGGADTPEAAFNTFKSAVGNNDWETATAQLTSESQDVLASGMMMMAAFASISFDADEAKAREESFNQLLAKHGLDKDQMDQDTAFGAEDPSEAMGDLMAPVKNKPAFVADMIAWIEKNSDDENGGMMEEITSGQLQGVEITGDTAKGKIAMTKDGETNEEPVEFRKIGGKWFIHLPMNG